MSIAPNFTIITPDRLNDLLVVPPYENKDRALPWVRGFIRIKQPSGPATDFVVTGPKLRVLYSGCRWNRVVFAVDTGDILEPWIRSVAHKVETIIWTSPELYKPGAKTSNRFMFDLDAIRPSSDPLLCPDELRMRLATYRKDSEENPDDQVDVVNAHLFMINEVGQEVNIAPSDVQGGGYIVPIFRISYFRNIERFGLTLTLLKGMYIPPMNTPTKNEDWVMDTSSN